MRVLVTGGQGFVGSHAAEKFAEEGDEIVVIDNLSRLKDFNFAYQPKFEKLQLSNIEQHACDVRSFEDLMKIAGKPQLIIHTAGQVAVTISTMDPRLDFEVNALGTFNVLELARRSDAAVICCSTNKVYGDNVNKIPVREEATRYSYADPKYAQGIDEKFNLDLCGHSPYGSSKLAGDLYVQEYAHTYGLRTAVFRMSCIYGERQLGVEDQGWVSWFTIAAVTDRPINIYGDGRQVRDVLHVADLVDAFSRFYNSGIHHGVYNIGGGPASTLSLLELIAMLEKKTGRPMKVRFVEWRPSDQKVYVSDVSKAEKVLGWKRKISTEEGMDRLYAWVTENRAIF